METPRVTIVDPSHPDRLLVDVVGDDDVSRSRRGPACASAIVVLLLGWQGADELLERRAAAAEERRLQAVIELELSTELYSGSERRSPDDVAEVVRQVGLRNAGPRPVQVLSATYGSLTQDGTLTIGPGRLQPLTLSTRLSCAERPAHEPVEEMVRLLVRSADGTVAERRLPLPLDAYLSDSALVQRACGYLEPYEAGMAIPTGTSRLQGDVLLVDLLVGNQSRAPLELAHLSGGSGMALDVTTVDGQPSGMPVAVPPGAGSGSGDLPMLAVTVALRVQDCSAVVAPDLQGQDFEEASAATIVTAFARPGSEPDPTAHGVTPLEQRHSVAELLRLSCG